MARNTIKTVRQRVEHLKAPAPNDDVEFGFTCHGVGENQYRLVNEETGDTFGPVCYGATEFLKFLDGFEAGLML